MMNRIYRSIWRLRSSLPAITSPWATMAIYAALLVAIGASGPKLGDWMSRINHRDGLWVWFVIGAVYGHAKWLSAKKRFDEHFS
jgi:hypothetical protein